MILNILRGVLIVLVAVVASLYILPSQTGLQLNFNHVVLLIFVTMGLAGLVIAADVFTPHKKLSALSGVILGLIVGLVAAYPLTFVVDLVGLLTAPEVKATEPSTPGQLPPSALANDREFLMALAKVLRSGEPEPSATAPQPAPAATQPATASQPHSPADRAHPSLLLDMPTHEEQVHARQAYLNLLQGVKVFIGLLTCYLGVSLVLQTRGDFRFIIPYVEFAKEIRGSRPTILDTSVIIDGRIVDIVQTHLMQVGLIVPRFVLQELQTVADSADKLKRARGRRGLEVLQKLQSNPHLEVSILDADSEGAGVDQKLLSLAKQLNARIMTNDFNLNKVATLRGVQVININDLAAALRLIVLPGEGMHIRVVKPGEGPTQGVGYLDDGTMVVVEGARQLIGQEIDLTVTSMLQTSAGRMIFGRYAPSAFNPPSNPPGARPAPPEQPPPAKR